MRVGVSPASAPGQDISTVSVSRGTRATWGNLVNQHEAYIEDKADDWLIFVGDEASNSGEMLFRPYTHRWKQGYTRRQYAKINDFVRGAREEYDDPHVVLLPALTASTMTPAGTYRPPLDHFEELKQSWSRGVRYELNHVMNADREKDQWPTREWEYLQIWEPTTNAGYTEGGYAHLHPVVVCDGNVGAERFRSVLEKHVEKSEWANPEAHGLDEIDIQPLDDFVNPAAYLFKYLSKSWNRDDAAPYQRRFDALLYETGYRRFQPSDGAQRWMQPDDTGSSGSWLFLGVGDSEQVERLREFEDAHEFRIEHEMGVVSWLSGYESPDAVAVDERDHSWRVGQCLKCGLSERALNAGRAPWDGPAGRCPGEPPPR